MKKLILFFLSLTMVSLTFAAGTIRYVPGTYPTISAAIFAANPGDIIQVASGTFTESILVYKSDLTIIGAGPTSTTIKTIGYTPAITLSANNLILKDLKITHNFKMREGIRVNAPASYGLTVDNVYFTNISNDANNGFGININTSMADVTISNSQFTATAASQRAMAVYGAKDIVMSNWLVENTSFSKLYVGLYFNSSVSGLTVQNNNFGPWDLADCRQAASGLYIGDGGATFDIDNVTVTGNTFTSYARGVYFLNNAANRTIGSTVISDNTFTNSIYSSGIRIVAGTQEFGAYEPSTLEGPFTINGNTFTQSSKIVNGSGVAMIDFRSVTGGESSSSLISITNNIITFSNTFDVSTWGVLLRGPIKNADINWNTFTGVQTGVSPDMPPTVAICMQTDYLDYGPMAANAYYNIRNNSITGFVYGIAAFNMLSKTYGGIPVGAVVDLKSNTIADNTYGIYSGAGERINALNNWWGADTGPFHTTNPTGTGNAVTDYVDFLPFYLAVPNTSVSGTVEPSETVCYDAAEEITVAGLPATFLVKNGAIVNMIAGRRILYLPGTTVELGGYMHGQILQYGPFCPPSDKSTSPSANPGTLFSANEEIMFKAYPNPTDGNFTLIQKGDNPFNNVKLEMLNMRGEIIITRELSGQKSYTFSISDYPSGFYFLKLVDDDHVETIKLIKTN